MGRRIAQEPHPRPKSRESIRDRVRCVDIDGYATIFRAPTQKELDQLLAEHPDPGPLQSAELIRRFDSGPHVGVPHSWMTPAQIVRAFAGRPHTLETLAEAIVRSVR